VARNGGLWQTQNLDEIADVQFALGAMFLPPVAAEVGWARAMGDD